jgi:DNA-binding transcriptional ArsR family regulator
MKSKKIPEKITIAGKTIESAACKKAHAVFRAFNHPLRQAILTMLNGKQNGVMVTDIYRALKIEQSVASQHLKHLRNANLVSTKRDGKKIYYSINEAGFKKMIESIQILTAGK